MSIAARTTIANQIRAYRFAHPEAAELDIAHHFGVQPVLVKNALGRKQQRRVKSVAR